MSDSDDTWEEFFGPSTELMPSIMHALDGILDGREDAFDDDDTGSSSREDLRATPPPRKVYQANNFANLSFNVQKILSHVSDQEIIGSKRFASEESLPHKRPIAGKCKRSSPEKALYKSNESLELISPNVQKMLSNLPDTELVISNTSADDGKKVKRNSSFLHAKKDAGKIFVVHKTQDENGDENECDRLKQGDSESGGGAEDSFTSKPLGSYMHTSPSGIASRTPVGRKNMGKYLQVPSESSVGTNSTTSSEVSRPVSLTSLGSCSSSGSSGTHQPGSAYQASAESLDSDPEPSGIQGSADSGIAEEPTAICRKEYDVVAEIIDTETKYVEDLHKVIQDYLELWRADPDCSLREHLPHLFSNLEAIYEFNSSFLEQLKEAKLDPSLTAKVFINNSGFSIYTDYCTHYPKTLTVLTELMGNEETARYFRDVQLQKNHDLPLGSYLLKPVQRILRYRLLLERLSEMCKPEHKPVVDLALTTMTGVAFHINSMKRKHENAVRIQEILSQLYGWDGPDLTTLGELIAEGTFRVGGVKGRRHVFLFDKLLLLTKCKHDGTITYKSHIMCSNLMLVEQVRGEPLSFHVLPFDNPRLQCTLRARSPQHKREWTGQLKRVIIENYNAEIPNHAQQLLMQLGQDPPEKEESGELWTPLKQHSTPQYLERRTRVRKSRDFSTRRAASHDRSFPSLGSWRRKSEPNVIQQYDTKTVPSRISKLKKAKESTATFYTDLSDSETCDVIDETDSNRTKIDPADDAEQSKSIDGDDDGVQEPKTQGKIVSDLIMQNEEFHKAISRRNRNLRESETDPNICIKQEKDPVATKADSLPRSFQLNDQIDNSSSECLNKSETSLKEADVEADPDISSQLSNSDHPEHKIYRKSAIRFSLLQRYHAIKDRHKKSTAKQASKIIGARIANPDYEDPQKLFSSPQYLSQSTMSISSGRGEVVEFDAPEDLDLTISENEVLTEFDKRMHKSQEELVQEDDCSKKSSQGHSASTSEICTTVSKQVFNRCSSDIITSSQNSDSYYECLLEKTLNDEVNIEKCDSFRISSTSNSGVTQHKYSENGTSKLISAIRSPLLERKCPQRPTKAPPPIPAKPARFLNTDNNTTSLRCSSTNVVVSHSSETYTRISRQFTKKENSSASKISEISNSERIQSKGWVKTIVGRFE